MKYCVFLLIVLMLSCKKDISNPVNDQPATSFAQVFDQFWNKMEVNYLYWDIDTTNWMAIHDKYKPLFAQLQLDNQADLQQSVSYFRAIVKGLIDHHYTITFTNPFLANTIISPASDKILSEPDFRNPYSFIVNDERYLDPGYIYGVDNTITPGKSLITLSGTVNGNILFFACNQFALTAAYQSNVSSSLVASLNLLFSRLANPTGLKAVILDLRDNQGGAVTDLNFLAGRFIDKPLPFGFTRYKSGNGTLDYTPWIKAAVQPQSGAKAVSVPILILADRYSASMAEILTMALHVLPQCKIIGETTFGATGPLTANSVYNDGGFDVTGFMSVETSSTEFKYIDGMSYEGKGVAPDYPVPYSAAALSTGSDPQMEKALSLVQ